MASRTVTSAPARRAAAATSRPIQPPPMITSRRPARSLDLMRSESSTERR